MGKKFTAETAEGAEVKKLKKGFLCELCELGGKKSENASRAGFVETFLCKSFLKNNFLPR